MQIDTLVVVLADQNGGKSNQMRTIFEEHELFDVYGGYPTQSNIARRYLVAPDVELLVRLSSWHERDETYTQVKTDISSGRLEPRRRYKVFVPAQVTATRKLVAGEELFIKLMTDFEVRRGFAVWLNPDVSGRTPFSVSPTFASFMSTRREVSALALDSLALKPSAAPKTNSINARMFSDMLFRA
jgi:hypothetical protein